MLVMSQRSYFWSPFQYFLLLECFNLFSMFFSPENINHTQKSYLIIILLFLFFKIIIFTDYYYMYIGVYSVQHM